MPVAPYDPSEDPEPEEPEDAPDLTDVVRRIIGGGEDRRPTVPSAA